MFYFSSCTLIYRLYYYEHEVDARLDTAFYSCECRMYETTGLLICLILGRYLFLFLILFPNLSPFQIKTTRCIFTAKCGYLPYNIPEQNLYYQFPPIWMLKAPVPKRAGRALQTSNKRIRLGTLANAIGRFSHGHAQIFMILDILDIF